MGADGTDLPPGGERSGRSGAASLLLGAVLVAPSIAWIAIDTRAWSWDPSYYAFGTVDLWRALSQAPSSWPQLMRTVLYAKAPLIAWLGQLFVPLGERLGSIETGLLASVWLYAWLMLALTWRLCRLVRPGSMLPALAAVILVGGSPLFVSMSHAYLVEVLQALTISYLFWVAARATAWSAIRTALHLALAVELGLLAKISTPAFVVAPALLAAARALAAWRRRGMGRLSLPDWALAIAVVLAAVPGMSWYAVNGERTLQFARVAASSEYALHWGHRADVPHKLLFWAEALWRDFAVPSTAWIVLGGAVAAAVLRAARGPGVPAAAALPRRDRALVATAALELVLVFAVLSRTVNEDSRYLLALGPSLAVLLAGLLPGGRFGRLATLGVVAAGTIQWAEVHASALALPGAPAIASWTGPCRVEPARRALLERVVEQTCDASATGRWSLVGVDLDWFNGHALSFYSAKAALRSGWRCYYQSFGMAPTDLEAAWKQLDEIDAVNLITFDPVAAPYPTDPLNQLAIPIVERARRDPALRQVPFDPATHVLIFRRTGSTPR